MLCAAAGGAGVFCTQVWDVLATAAHNRLPGVYILTARGYTYLHITEGVRVKLLGRERACLRNAFDSWQLMSCLCAGSKKKTGHERASGAKCGTQQPTTQSMVFSTDRASSRKKPSARFAVRFFLIRHKICSTHVRSCCEPLPEGESFRPFSANHRWPEVQVAGYCAQQKSI